MSQHRCDTSDRADRLQAPVLVDGKWVKSEQGDGGIVRFMARSGGYVMCRRPRCAPFVVTEKEWARMPLFQREEVKL